MQRVSGSWLVVAVGLLSVASLVLGGCEAKECPAEDPALDSCSSGFYVEFDPDDTRGSELRPFPNPIHATKMPFKVGTTGYSPMYEGTYGRLLNTLDGFGPYAPVLVEFNEVIDPVFLPQQPEESLDPASPVFLVDLDAIRANPGASFASVVQPVTAWYASTRANVPVNTLAVAPYVPLQPKREYAVVITDRMRTWTNAERTQSACVGPSKAFNCSKAKGEVGPTIEPMRQGLAPLYEWLEGRGFERGEISIALNFTTMSIADELIDVHEQIDAMPKPKGVIDAERVFLDVSDPATGKLTPAVKNYFQQLFPPDLEIDIDFDDYEFESMGTIAYGFFDSRDFRHPEFSLFITDGVNGHVRQQSTNKLEFMVVLPKPDAARGIAPPYKTVVFQHALTVCKESMVVIANEFNRRGLAVVGIDVVNHGSRSEEMLAGGPRQCTIEALDFLQLDDPLAAREGFRQTVADQFQFIDMVQELPLDIAPMDGVRDIDTQRLAYVSQSLGSIIGATFVALEPDVGAAVLNVGGGGLYSVALSFFGDQGGQPVGPDGFVNLPTLLLDLMLIIQNTLDRADPINYARHVVREPLTISGVTAPPKNVLLQEAVGDDVVGNYSTDSLTREMGGEVAGPTVFRQVPGLLQRDAPFFGNVAGGQSTVAMTQFSPAAHSFLLTLDDPGAFCRGQVQAAEFVDSYMRNGVSRVIDAYTAPEAALCPP